MGNRNQEFLAVLQRAADRAARSAAPDWLKQVLRAAVSEAGALAPVADEAAAAPDFIYPH